MDCKFVSDPDDTLKCSICLEVAKDPKQEEVCGKLFCSACIRRVENDCSPCPACRTPRARYFVDNKSRREIQALAVLCDNEENGCDWEGTVGTSESHTRQCGFAYVSCPNDCGRNGSSGTLHDVQILRKDLDDHLATDCPEIEYACEHCSLRGPYRFITESHDDECEMKIVCCSNDGCSIVMERGQVEFHVIDSCDYTVVYCKYASIGCDMKDLRMNMEQHENDSGFHLSMAVNKIAEFSKAALSSPYRKEGITFKLKKFNKKSQNEPLHYFQPFFTSPSGYMIRLSVGHKGDRVILGGGARPGIHLSAGIEILHGPYDDGLEWPLKAVFTIELLNQLADCDHQVQKIAFDGNHCKPGCIGWVTSKFITLVVLPCSGNIQYLNDDALYFRVTTNISNRKPWLDHTHE